MWSFHFYLCGQWRTRLWSFEETPYINNATGNLQLDAIDQDNVPGWVVYYENTSELSKFEKPWDLNPPFFILRVPEVVDYPYLKYGRYCFKVHNRSAHGIYRMKESWAGSGGLQYPDTPLGGELIGGEEEDEKE